MDLKQLENILAIYQEKSISRAAEKMFMTQSAMNQQLLKLEKEFGTPLFERRYHEMIPTFAGRVYINAARQILSIRQETYKVINDIANGDAGEISIAYTPERGSLLFSKVYPVFHREYPNYHFRIHEARGLRAEQLLLSNEVTFAFMTYSKQRPLDPRFACIDTGEEYIIMAVPETHPMAGLAGAGSASRLPHVDLKLFEHDKFILPSDVTSLRSIVDFVFQENAIVPDILFESASTATTLNMAVEQMGPVFIPESYVRADLPLVYFRTRPELSWKRCAAYLKDTYVSKAEHRLIDLTREFQDAYKGARA